MAVHKSTTGAFHIGLDLFQSASGFDFLGVVLFRLLIKERKPVIIDRFMLECLRYIAHHLHQEKSQVLHRLLGSLWREN